MFQFCNRRVLLAQGRDILSMISPHVRCLDTRSFTAGQMYGDMLRMQQKVKVACEGFQQVLYMDTRRGLLETEVREALTNEVMNRVVLRWNETMKNELHAVAHMLHPLRLKEIEDAERRALNEEEEEGGEGGDIASHITEGDDVKALCQKSFMASS